MAQRGKGRSRGTSAGRSAGRDASARKSTDVGRSASAIRGTSVGRSAGRDAGAGRNTSAGRSAGRGSSAGTGRSASADRGAGSGRARSANANAERKRRRQRAKRRKRRLVLFGLLLCCALLIYGIISLRRYQYVKGFPDDVISENISVASVDLSGLTQKEAKKELEQNLSGVEQVEVTLETGKEKVSAPLDDLGVSYDDDVEKAVQDAFNYGKSGSIGSRYHKLKKLEKEKKNFGKGYKLDDEKAKAVLESQVVPLTNHAVNATMKRDDDGEFEIVKEKPGQTVNMEQTLAKITDKLNNNWDQKAFSVEAVLRAEKAKVTARDLKNVKDELGSYSTDAGGGGRWRNLMTGAGRLNGTVLAPGDELSVHDATAPYDEEHGYVAAGSYENGQVVDTYGGGICQVSTTLYNAVLYAELEVVKRYPHSMLVAYVDPSRDAAIAGDTKDFVFKNNYDSPVYIEGEITDDNELTFRIYGHDTRKKGRTVEFESETTATEEYETIYQDDPDLPEGEKEYEGSPHVGKTARLWKIVKQDGKQVSRDIINESVYQKSDQIIRVGTKTD